MERKLIFDFSEFAELALEQLVEKGELPCGTYTVEWHINPMDTDKSTVEIRSI